MTTTPASPNASLSSSKFTPPKKLRSPLSQFIQPPIHDSPAFEKCRHNEAQSKTADTEAVIKPTPSSALSVDVAQNLKEECMASQKLIRSHQEQLKVLQRIQKESFEFVTKHFMSVQEELAHHFDELQKQYQRFEDQHRHLDTLFQENENKNEERNAAANHHSTCDFLAGEKERATKRTKLEIIDENVAPKLAQAWDLSRCGQFGTILARGRTVQTTAPGWNIVIGSNPCHRFSVKFVLPKSKGLNAIAIGFTHTPEIWELPVKKPNTALMFNETGWYLNVRKGTLCSPEHDDHPFGPKGIWKSGDIVTCVYDDDAGTIRFMRNKDMVDLGIAFHHIPKAKAGDRMYPTLISYDRGLEMTFWDPVIDSIVGCMY